jgi:cobalt/nickel transport system permease protein
VGSGHAHLLYRHGVTPVHRLPAQCKLVATIAFVLVVVLTPREQFWAFGCHAVLLAGVAAIARVPAPLIGKRLLVELPFVLFAVLLPFVAHGERVDVLGLHLSVEGLYGAWNILAKATLGVIASILLAATTDLPDLLGGLQRLRMPQLLVQIMTFMLRYSQVVTSDMARMRIARESRGFAGRDIRQFRVFANAVQALFIRSYERGERVHTAMLSRGYTGSIPSDEHAAPPGMWARAVSLPLAAAAIAGTAIMTS